MSTSSIEKASPSEDEPVVSSSLHLSLEERESRVEALAQELGINHKKLMWKIDLWVVPPFCLLYFLSFLDRVNISNANVYGIQTELGLVGNQFNTAICVFFLPYVIFEVLSNYCLKIVKPHLWLSIMILFFGAVTVGQGFVKNFGGLVACRFLLGIFESGSFPAIFYILANFYNKEESQRRFSTFFSTTCLAGGCAGALAYRINDLDGVHGHSTWRWIFIIEGAFTMGLAIVLYFTVADFPEECRFLNANERLFLKEKLKIHLGDSGYEVKQTWKDVLEVFKDPMIYITSFCYFGLIIPAYGYAYFSVVIIKLLGYTAMNANRQSIYPWLAAFGYAILLAFASDYVSRKKRFARYPFYLLAAVTAAVGLIMVLAIKNTSNLHAKYAGCFLAASGLYTAMPIIICWFSLNFGGHTRKSVGTAYIVGFGNLGGIVAPWLFLKKESPDYTKGLSVCVAFVVFSMLMTTIYLLYIMYSTKRKETEAYRAKWNALSLREQIMKGDLNPDFKYMY